MRFYTTEQLSPNIAETPEGFLICRDVPIARTGVMEYGPDETPIAAGDDGLARIERLPEDVFDLEAVASFEGKPFVIDHPGEDVTPENWRELACGHAQNVRRGEGEASDLLLADLLVTDERAISLVRGGLREISCGYDAEYEETGPGQGRQILIRGNHVALVARGRCGGRCRINDNHNEEGDMKPKKKSFTDRFLDVFRRPEVRRALDSLEEDPAAPPKKDEEQPAPTDQDTDLAARVDGLEAKVEELGVLLRQLLEAQEDEQPAEDEEAEAPAADEEGEEPAQAAATGDAARKAKARDTRTVDKDTLDRAILLMPGFKASATDSRCAVQRVTLRSAVKDAAVGKIVLGALRGATLDGCDCLTLDAAFVAASEFVRERNNLRTADGLTKATARDFGKAVSPADINEVNRAFHAKKGV